MPLIEVKLTEHPVKVSQKIIRDLFWYDPEYQILRKFKGTRMDWEYYYDTSLSKPKNRLIPQIVTAEQQVTVLRKDIKDIIKWFDNYQNYNSTNIEIDHVLPGKKGVVFEVPDNEVDDFTYDLERNNFNYEVT